MTAGSFFGVSPADGTGSVDGEGSADGTGSCATRQLFKDESTRIAVAAIGATIGAKMAAFKLLTAVRAVFFQVWRLDRFMFSQSWKNFKV